MTHDTEQWVIRLFTRIGIVATIVAFWVIVAGLVLAFTRVFR